MRTTKYLAFVMALVLLPVLARAQTSTPIPVLTPQDIKKIEDIKNQATFCEGTYALCIKAPCTAIPTLGRLGNYYIDRVLCSCDVQKGISMGPGQCEDRRPVTQNGRTYMISTYSNAFNERNNSYNTTLRCTSASTLWAWCYGAPCVVDDRDPNKAHCTCPVETSAMQTLGGNCTGDNCKYIWSAATIAGDDFANKHFYDYVKKHYPNYPVKMQAQLCTPSAVK